MKKAVEQGFIQPELHNIYHFGLYFFEIFPY